MTPGQIFRVNAPLGSLTNPIALTTATGTNPAGPVVTRVDCSPATGAEVDPNGLDSHTAGAKLDAGKSPIWQGALAYFPRAISAVARVSAIGARKYAWKGWESVPDGINRYSNALGRHFGAEGYEDIDADTGCLHAEQVAWNSLARLELILKEKEERDKG